MDKETKNYFDKHKALRIAKVVGGTVATGIVATAIPGSAAIIPASISLTYTMLNGISDDYKDLVMSFIRQPIPFSKKTMSQSAGFVSKECKEQIKSKIAGEKSEITVTNLMSTQIILGIDREKVKMQDKMTKKWNRDEKIINVSEQKYNTNTHSVNIGTLKILDELGYINIESIKYKGKSSLEVEKSIVNSLRKGDSNLVSMAKVLGVTVKNEIIKKVDSFMPKDKKIIKNPANMYEVNFRITDKQIDYDELINYVQENRKGRSDGKEESYKVKYLSFFEGLKKDKQSIVEERINEAEKSRRVASKTIRDGLNLISIDKKSGINFVNYKTDEEEHKSVLAQYKEKKIKQKNKEIQSKQKIELNYEKALENSRRNVRTKETRVNELRD